MSIDRYELQELVAVQWNPALAQLFPGAEHHMCRQEMWEDKSNHSWQAFTPPRCVGWHCPECGRPCNMMGHHDCGAR